MFSIIRSSAQRVTFIRLILSISILLTNLFTVTGCQKHIDPVSQSGFYFDTVINISLYNGTDFNDQRAKEVLAGCFDLCGQYEDLLSSTKEGSDIWKINHANGAPTKVSAQTARLITKAISFCELTDGVLDITIQPIAELWNFSSESLEDTTDPKEPTNEAADHSVPDTSSIRSLLSHVDYHTIQVAENTVTLADPDARIDLGCIAKGFIADELKQYLSEQKITDAIINLGGNVLVLGSKEDQQPFRVGIRKPFDANGSAIASLPMTDSTLVTSGTYERCFTVNGRLYHHLLNAKTGMPENNGLLSVSILCSSSTDADGLSTACYLMGIKKGMEYIESIPDTEALFITDDYELHPTSGLESVLQNP